MASPSGGSIARTDFVGGWRITTASETCTLSTSLTAWGGGARATSRGCNSFELQKISAWVIQGNQVVLKGSDGSLAATLASAGPERFQGTTASNQTITVSR